MPVMDDDAPVLEVLGGVGDIVSFPGRSACRCA